MPVFDVLYYFCNNLIKKGIKLNIINFVKFKGFDFNTLSIYFVGDLSTTKERIISFPLACIVIKHRI